MVNIVVISDMIHSYHAPVTYSRVSITVPAELLTAADQRARELDRPRSWVVSEALRVYLGRAPGVSGEGLSSPRRVSEPGGPAYAATEVAAARARHLEADLRLPPAERLRRAEELGRLARERQPRGHRYQVIGFDTYEDFYEWKKARRAGV